MIQKTFILVRTQRKWNKFSFGFPHSHTRQKAPSQQPARELQPHLSPPVCAPARQACQAAADIIDILSQACGYHDTGKWTPTRLPAIIIYSQTEAKTETKTHTE